MRGRLAALLVALALPASSALAEEKELRLPRTFEKTSYRAKERSAFAIGRLHAAKGDLTITKSGLEFVARNKKLYVPLALVHIVSFGNMKGDVDTDWVVLSVGERGKTELVGFRDGSKLGFGKATREIYDMVVGAAREARAAQYDVPEGYRAFDAFSEQGTFAVPEAWENNLTSARVGSHRGWGTVVFAPPDAGGSITGNSPSIFVTLHDAQKGMACEGLSEEAAGIALGLAQARVRDHGIAGAETLQPSPVSMGGCNGLRFVGRGRTATGLERAMEIQAAAHGTTLLLLGAYPPEGEAGDAWRDALGTALSTLKFPVARSSEATR